MMESERETILVCLAHLLLNKAQQHSGGTLDLKDSLEGCPFHEKFASCGNPEENCECLPHLCFTSFKRLRLKISKNIDETLNKSNHDIVHFVIDYYESECNNPILECMQELGYPLDYILEWTYDCSFELMVLKNLDFFAHTHLASEEISWVPMNGKLNNTKVRALEKILEKSFNLPNFKF